MGRPPPRWLPLLNPVSLAAGIARHRHLVLQLARREIHGRYKGTTLGLLWSLGTPLVLLATYTFVFGIVFRARWPGQASSDLGEFGLVLFCGLVAFGIFSELVGRAPSLVLGVPNYVKKVVFPLEVLPVSALLAALFQATIGLGVIVAAQIATGRAVHPTWLLLPVVIVPIACLSLGIAWALSALGVFVRDLQPSVALVLQVLFFVTPIFYPLQAVPAAARPVIAWNPLATLVEQVRQVVVFGQVPALWPLVTSWGVALVVMQLGYAVFMRSKKAFADVM
jgi:lipopolysaccharide transport system permease protein